MKITKTKFAAATFGAALTSLYSAPELNAQIIDINIDPGTVAFSSAAATQATAVTPVEFTNVVSGSYDIPGVANAAVGAFNDTYGVGIYNIFGGFNGGISQFALVQPGDFFTTGSVGNLNFGTTETGVRYIGFVAGGSVGWFSIDLGTAPDDELVFTGGQFFVGGAAPGEPFGIMVGATDSPVKGDVNQDGAIDFFDIQPFIDVLSAGGDQAEADANCDGTVDFFDIQPFIDILAGGTGLAGLALGATGLRRRRKALSDSAVSGQESD